MLSRRVCLALFIVAVAATFAHAQRGISVNDGPAAVGNRRVALVIGNGDYDTSPLRNPVNDARAMAQVLGRLGFAVTLKTDVDQRDMERAINRFGKSLPKDGVALFFYAGHGLQINGRNYLIPIGKQISDAADVKYDAVDAGRVVDRMEQAHAMLNIVILDACRDNPFRGLRSGGQGLAAMTGGSGTIIAFATSPGSYAADGSGNNGVYTGALVRNLTRPGLSVEQVFKRTAAQVQKQRSEQIPWFTSSFTGDFYFQPGAPQAKPTPMQLAGGPGATGPTKQERIAKLLDEADALMGAGKLTTPAGNNALEKYNRVLFLQPMNSAAAEGLKKIAAKYVEWARARIKAGDYDKAEAYLQRAEEAREGDPRVLAALDELRRSKAAPRPTATARPVQQTGSSGTPRRITNSLGMEFVLIPAGSFNMGSPSSEPKRDSDEGPQHRVTISKPFYMQTTEVTRGQFRRFVEATGYRTDAEKGDGLYILAGNKWKKKPGSSWREVGFSQDDTHPVVGVSWNDAQAFIKWLNAQEGGNKYGLPTEAQWEYSCRAGTTTPFNTGENITTSQANYDGNYPMPGYSKGQYRKQTLPVKSFSPNKWGLYDMHGNVWEWCGDWYGENYYSSSPTRDPQGPSSGTIRVLRGGGWDGRAGVLRSAFRGRVDPGLRNYFIGFRITRITP